MCRSYLAYKIPTSHFVEGKCYMTKDARMQTCSCGKFTFVIMGRYRSKTDIICVSKTKLSNANKLYKNSYPFRVFKISKGFKDGMCKTCRSEYIMNESHHTTNTHHTTNKNNNLKYTPELDVETKLDMDLDSIIRYNMKLNPLEPIPEDWESGCIGDSLHDPNISKEKLDRELKCITSEDNTKYLRDAFKPKQYTLVPASVSTKTKGMLFEQRQYTLKPNSDESDEILYL